MRMTTIIIPTCTPMSTSNEKYQILYVTADFAWCIPFMSFSQHYWPICIVGICVDKEIASKQEAAQKYEVAELKDEMDEMEWCWIIGWNEVGLKCICFLKKTEGHRCKLVLSRLTESRTKTEVFENRNRRQFKKPKIIKNRPKIPIFFVFGFKAS